MFTVKKRHVFVAALAILNDVDYDQCGGNSEGRVANIITDPTVPSPPPNGRISKLELSKP